MSYMPFLSSDKQPLICREKMEFCDTVSQHHGRGCEPYFPEDPPPTPAVLGGGGQCSKVLLVYPETAPAPSRTALSAARGFRCPRHPARLKVYEEEENSQFSCHAVWEGRGFRHLDPGPTSTFHRCSQ